jgi:hypothetical protein
LYQIPGLNESVSKTIAKNLDKENVVDILRFAEMNNAKKLYKVEII